MLVSKAPGMASIHWAWAVLNAAQLPEAYRGLPARWSTILPIIPHFSCLRLAFVWQPPSASAESRITAKALTGITRAQPAGSATRGAPPRQNAGQGQTSAASGGVPKYEPVTTIRSAELPSQAGGSSFLSLPQTSKLPPTPIPGQPAPMQALGSGFLAWHTEGCQQPDRALAASRPCSNGWATPTLLV